MDVAVDQSRSYRSVAAVSEIVFCRIIVLVRLTFCHFFDLVVFDFYVTCKRFISDAVIDTCAFKYQIHNCPPIFPARLCPGCVFALQPGNAGHA